MKTRKPWFLPVIAGILLVTALLVLFLVPGENRKRGASNAAENTVVAGRNADGDFVVETKLLSSDRVLFIRLPDESGIELLARVGEDGTPKVALGTCQSCNGSPSAYFTQEQELLVCHNCGQSFPLSAIDAPGGGCRPMQLDGAVLQVTDEELIFNAGLLSTLAPLFEGIVSH